jgi:hypothetical protein
MRSLVRTAVLVVTLLTVQAAPALAGLPGEWERTEQNRSRSQREHGVRSP